MRYCVIINQNLSLELGLNPNEAALLCLFNELSSWADTIVVNGEAYYHLSRGKVVQELPLFYKKPDTVYRAFKKLHELKLVDYTKQKNKDLLRLTALGKKYNKLGNKSEKRPDSEINPSKLGNESESEKEVNVYDYQVINGENSDSFPTYNNKYTSDNTYTSKNFLKNWNEMRVHFLKTESNLNKLRSEEQADFNESVKLYSKDDFHKALYGLFKQKSVPKDIMLFRPKHFLKNIDQYLDAENNKKYDLYV